MGFKESAVLTLDSSEAVDSRSYIIPLELYSRTRKTVVIRALEPSDLLDEAVLHTEVGLMVIGSVCLSQRLLQVLTGVWPHVC